MLVVAFGFEGASSGSAGLVAFWLFCVVNIWWSGMRSRLLGVEFQLGKIRRNRSMRRGAYVAVVGCFSCPLEWCCPCGVFLTDPPTLIYVKHNGDDEPGVSKFSQTLDFCIIFNKSSQRKI